MKINNKIKNLIIIFAIIFGFALLDQVTKLIVVRTLNFNDAVSVIPNFFYLEYIHNEGAAWGMFAGNKIVILGMPPLAIVIFSFLLSRTSFNKQKFYVFGLSLMIAGTIGNYIDRLFLGYVVDFLSFRFGSYHYPNFNVADMSLVIGVAMFSIDILFLEDRRLKESSKDEEINNKE